MAFFCVIFLVLWLYESNSLRSDSDSYLRQIPSKLDSQKAIFSILCPSYLSKGVLVVEKRQDDWSSAIFLGAIAIAQWLNEFKLTMFKQEFILNAIRLHQFAVGI